MSRPILIYYQAGAYGTFIEWLLTYLTDTNIDDQLPFGRAGNSHKFMGNQLNKDHNSIEQATKTNNSGFARAHPEVVSVEQINSLFSSVIHIDIPSTSKLWIFNNTMLKININDVNDEQLASLREWEPDILPILNAITIGDCEFARYLLLTSNDQEYLKGYSVARVNDLKRWQLREIFSFWDHWMLLSPNSSCQFNNTYNITVEDLRDQLPVVIDGLIQRLQLNVISERYAKLDWVWQEWKSRQSEMDRDLVVERYINNVVNSIELIELRQFNIFEEAVIQQQLRKLGYEIKCDGLEYLPLRTTELKELLYNV